MPCNVESVQVPLTVISTFSLGGKRVFALLVLGHLVRCVLSASLALAVYTRAGISECRWRTDMTRDRISLTCSSGPICEKTQRLAFVHLHLLHRHIPSPPSAAFLQSSFHSHLLDSSSTIHPSNQRINTYFGLRKNHQHHPLSSKSQSRPLTC